MWNIAKMCAQGGEIIHVGPLNNQPNHGFYQFSPTLYYDFYEANGFQVEEASLYQMLDKPAGMRFSAPYRRAMSFASPVPLDGQVYNFYCRVRKISEPDRMTIPMQGAYAAIENWKPV